MKLFQSPVHTRIYTHAAAAAASLPVQPNPTVRKGLFIFICLSRFIFALISPFSSRRTLMGGIPTRGGRGDRKGRHATSGCRESRVGRVFLFLLFGTSGLNPRRNSAILPSMPIKLIILSASISSFRRFFFEQATRIVDFYSRLKTLKTIGTIDRVV